MKINFLLYWFVSIVLLHLNFGALAQNIYSTDIQVCPSCETVINGQIKEIKHNENSIYISPNTTGGTIILNSNNSVPVSPGNIPFGIGIFISYDGGQNWYLMDGIPYTNTSSYADPSSVIDRLGNYYVSKITGSSADISIARFLNISNISHTTIFQNPSGHQGQDKQHLTADNNLYSPHVNNLYCAWSDFKTGPPKADILVSFSTDQGLSWLTSPVNASANVSTTYQHHGANIQTGANGEIYVVWSIYDGQTGSSLNNEAGIGFAKLEVNATGTSLQVVDSKRIPVNGSTTTIKGIRYDANMASINVPSLNNSFPVMTVNQQNGHIYIAWINQGVPGVNSGNNPDVYFISSYDEGLSWNVPIKINNEGNTAATQYFVWISCDPLTGTLAAIYYDTRSVTLTNNQADTYVALSDDEGLTWQEHKINDNPYNWTDSGDYIGIAIQNNYVCPNWTGNDLTTGIDGAFTQCFSIACSTDVVLCNINENTSQFYKASNTINVAGNPVSCYYNLLPSGGDITFQAGASVKFGNGFHAEAGSTMHSFINTNCNIVGSISNEESQRVFNGNNENSIFQNQNYSEITNVKVYPNPGKDNIYLIFNLMNDSQFNLSLTDVSGRVIVILNKYLESGLCKIPINLNEYNLHQGIFILKLTSDQDFKTIKFAKI